MNYKSEFSHDFELGFKLADFPYLIDKSYRNDVCPSFYFLQDKQYYVLWTDHANPARREDTSAQRYVVQLAKNEGDEESPEIYAGDGEVVFEGEDAMELGRFIASLVK